MYSNIARVLVLSLFLGTAACGSGGTGNGNGTGATNDSGTTNDSRTTNDSGTTSDTGMADAGDSGDRDGSGSCESLGYTEVNGGVTLEKGCYTAENGLKLSEGTLTLEPGVVIIFSQGVGFDVTGNGSLSAVGASGEPIVLTGAVEERGHWDGLHFKGSDSPDNELAYVELEYAGGSQWHGGGISRGGIFIEGGGNRLSIANSTFRENGQAGIVAPAGGTDLTIENTTFENNETPLWIHANLVGELSSLDFSDNDNSYIRTALDSPDEAVSNEQTWPTFDIPYRASNDIRADATLTLAPGVTIKFEQGQGLNIGGQGRLTADGTSDAPITLTGIEEQRGFWKGIYYHETRSSDNVLNHVTVEYAGSGGWHGGLSSGGAYLRSGGVALEVANSTFRENANAGILADGGAAELSVTSSTFENNDLPLWVHANLVGNLNADNSFNGNDDSYVLVGTDGPGTTVSDDQNWANLSIPYRVKFDLRLGADLTLSSGMTITFEQNEGLKILNSGALIADASGGDRLTFIAADGETVNGFWKGIGVYRRSSKNVINNADIIYGGSGRWHGGSNSQAGVFLRNDAKIELNDVKIGGSGKYGVSVEQDAAIDPCSNVTFGDNDDANVFGGGTFACGTP